MLISRLVLSLLDPDIAEELEIMVCQLSLKYQVVFTPRYNIYERKESYCVSKKLADSLIIPCIVLINHETGKYSGIQYFIKLK